MYPINQTQRQERVQRGGRGWEGTGPSDANAAGTLLAPRSPWLPRVRLGKAYPRLTYSRHPGTR